MPEEKPKLGENNNSPADGLDRRTFVKVGLSCLALSGVGAAGFSYQFLSPNVLYEPSPLVNAGKPSRFPLNSVTLDAESGIFVVHAEDGFYALQAICTHLGCLTEWKSEQNLIGCPCHGSKFDRQGTKIAGPAPRPLPKLKMWVNDDGELMVDRSMPLSVLEYVRA